MTSQPLSGPRKASYALFLLALVMVARFDLGPCLLAGLISYMIMDVTERSLRRSGSVPRLKRWAAVAVFCLLAAVLAWIFIKFLTLGLVRLPVLLDTLLPRIDTITLRFGYDFPADNARQLRDLMVAALREHSSSIGKTSGLLTHGFFQIIIGMVAAVMRFLAPSPTGHAGHLYDSVRHEFNARVEMFMRSFKRVIGAQVMISALNTVLTSAVLHMMGFRFKTFLTLATFVCGLVPIVGNVVSNTLIVASGLTVSEHLALFGLIYMIAIHKFEYLLNSRIMGDSLDTPVWMTLLGLVVGEALMGVPGVLLAPALLHYARAELRALPSPARI